MSTYDKVGVGLDAGLEPFVIEVIDARREFFTELEGVGVILAP